MMRNFEDAGPELGDGESPKSQFVDVMHDAARAIAERNKTDLRFALDHARHIVDALSKEEHDDAMRQIDAYQEKFDQLEAQ